MTDKNTATGADNGQIRAGRGQGSAFDGLGPVDMPETVSSPDDASGAEIAAGEYRDTFSASTNRVAARLFGRVELSGLKIFNPYGAAYTVSEFADDRVSSLDLVLPGHANTEAEAVARADLSCSACGGSGHVDDERMIAGEKLEPGKVRLWREVDALGGARENNVDAAYDDAVQDILAILESRGFTEHADPLDRVRELEAEIEYVREERTAALGMMEQARADRDDFQRQRNEFAELRDDAVTDRKTYAAGLQQMTAERDAAAENARRERDRRGTYSEDMLKDCEDTLLDAIRYVGSDSIRSPNGEGPRKRGVIVEQVLRKAGLVSIREQKPHCRVVTSPRFYGEEEQRRAFVAIQLGEYARVPTPLPVDDVRTIFDAVATALGMRRTEA